MFKKNTKHLQLDMLGLFNSMSEPMQKKAMQAASRIRKSDMFAR